MLPLYQVDFCLKKKRFVATISAKKNSPAGGRFIPSTAAKACAQPGCNNTAPSVQTGHILMGLVVSRALDDELDELEIIPGDQK